jgi:hypothetical protein
MDVPALKDPRGDLMVMDFRVVGFMVSREERIVDARAGWVNDFEEELY